MLSATELLEAIALQPHQYDDKEIIVVPPHAVPLEPIVDSIEQKTGKTPHFAWFGEILYACPSDYWYLEEYREDMKNKIGDVIGAI